MCYNVSPRKNKNFYNFPIKKKSLKYVREHVSIPTDKRRGSRPLIVINPLPEYE